MLSRKILGIVVIVVEVIAWVALAAGLASFFIILIGGGQPGSPRAMSLVALFVGALYFAVLYVLTGIVRLLMNIEENTRTEGKGISAPSGE